MTENEMKQREGIDKAVERSHIWVYKARAYAALQIQEARALCKEQGFPETPENVIRLAGIIATNWASSDD